MPYFLGIDGGGSKTTCLLGDETNVLASITVGGSNIIRVSEEAAGKALRKGVREACQEAAIRPLQIAAICAGIAGSGREEIRKRVEQILAELSPARIEVVGDMVIAHEAALGGAPGIVVLAGTGSVAYGRHASGRTARAGGWGHAISDEGSGHWIGVQAVAAITRTLDSGSHTDLGDLVLQQWRLRSLDDLVSRANAGQVADFAELVPAVLKAAERDDSWAHDILAKAGVELAGLAKTVFRRLWNPGDEVGVRLAGGVFQNSAEVRDSFQRELQRSIPQTRVFLGRRSAAEGALALARKLHLSDRTNSRASS